VILDQMPPLLFAAAQLAVAAALAIPAFFIAALRVALKLALFVSLMVFAMVLALVLAFDLTSPGGAPSVGAALYVGGLGGLVWATSFFILSYVPLALIALLRARRS
jgi:hypothetical protein